MAIVITGSTITAPDGAIDAADLTGTLPALDGSALTNLDAADLTGTLPALDGSALTGIGAGSVEAWANFNATGTPAIRADGNVSTITDNGTGDYTLTFSTAISSANYAPHTNYGEDNNTRTTGMTSYEQPLTTSNRVYCSTGSGSASDRAFYSYSLVI